MPGHLAHDVVHVFEVALEQPPEHVGACARTLARDERERAARFVLERDRRRAIVARGALRMILAGYAHVAPEELEFAYGPRGKPALRGPGAAASLRFNASHSGDRALIGIARERELGADVECVRQLDDALGIAEQFFCAAERASLRSAHGADRLDTFFTYWTRKEAILKATGQGLGLPLDCVDVAWPRTPGGAARRTVQVRDARGAARHFCVVDLILSGGCKAAIAVEGGADWRGPDVVYQVGPRQLL